MGYLTTTSSADSQPRSESGVARTPDAFTVTLIRNFNKKLLPGSPLNTVVTRAARAKRTLNESCSPQAWGRVIRMYTLLARVADTLTNVVSTVEHMPTSSR
jgi:hypothetical protein